MLRQESLSDGGQLLRVDDPRWQALLLRCDSDAYHQRGYLEAAAEVEEGDLRIALVEAAGVTMGVPLMLRRLPFGMDGWDAVSPYGYPCPIATAQTPGQWSLLWQALRRLLAEEDIVSAFFRLHPLLTPPDCLQAVALEDTVVEHGDCVYLRLDQEEQALWSETRPRFRSNINALRRDGWRFVADDWSLLPEFLAIYSATMRRADAESFYYFPLSYYQSLRAGLGGDATLHAVLDPAGEVATIGLFLRHGTLVQYHLGGTAAAHIQAAPAKLLFHEVRLWYRSAGATLLHLGGGLGGRRDSLYRFKAGFSKCARPFCSLRMVVDPSRYRALVDTWSRAAGAVPATLEGYFPAYRAAVTSAASC